MSYQLKIYYGFYWQNRIQPLQLAFFKNGSKNTQAKQLKGGNKSHD